MPGAHDVGLLLLRVAPAALLWIFHVMPKLAHFGEELREFPDPLGLGHAFSFLLALGAEAVCSLLVAVGLATRLASLPIVVTMLMVLLLAARGMPGADVPSALQYAISYAVLLFTGGGRYSADHVLRGQFARIFTRVLRPREA